MVYTPCCNHEARIQFFSRVPRPGSLFVCPCCDTLLTFSDALSLAIPTRAQLQPYCDGVPRLSEFFKFGLTVGRVGGAPEYSIN